MKIVDKRMVTVEYARVLSKQNKAVWIVRAPVFGAVSKCPKLIRPHHKSYCVKNFTKAQAKQAFKSEFS